MSALTLVLTGALALTGIGAPVPAEINSAASSSAVVLTPDRAAESPSTALVLPTPTRSPVRPSAGSTAPATATPERRVKRVSAIHIARTPRTVTVVETETVVVAPAEEEREAVADARPETPRRNEDDVCLPPEGNYDGVEPYVGIIGAHIQDEFDVTDVKGKADREGASEHPKGLALDFMTNTGNVDGDKIAEYLLNRADDFGVMYVIWQQTLFVPGKDPQEMEDRGDDTANHRDHVHVSFHDEPGSVTPSC
jgi:hypothetical protein